jgi:hypothetical protein
MSKQVQRFEDDPRWQNRKGPGGYDLDKWEAIKVPLDGSTANVAARNSWCCC